MRNQVTKVRGITTPNSDRAAHWIWVGYDDARNGRGYRPEYERLLPQFQRNYERGRLLAAAIRGDGFAPPKWARNRRCSTTVRDYRGPAVTAEIAWLNTGRVAA